MTKHDDFVLVSNNGTYNQCCTYLKYTKDLLRRDWGNISRAERKLIQHELRLVHEKINKILLE